MALVPAFFVCHQKVMSKKRSPVQFIFLSLMLIVLPMGSWYFLNKGYNYYSKAINELQDYGPMPAFELLSQNNRILNKQSIENKMAVVAFVNPNASNATQTMSDIALMHKQFDKREDLLFLIHVLGNESMSAEAMQKLATQFNLTDDEQCFFLSGTDAQMQNLMSNKYQIPDLNSKSEDQPKFTLSQKTGSLNEYPYYVLIDIGQHICNYYDASDKASINRLVEHIALKLPIEVEEDPKLNRESEK